MPKLPSPPPPNRLRTLGRDLHTLSAGTLLWRIHNTVGSHVLAWKALRRFGPTSSRYDPQTPPPRIQARGVTYLATDLATALAERFQDDRAVDRRFGAPQLTAFATRTQLDLIDLTASGRCASVPPTPSTPAAATSPANGRERSWPPGRTPPDCGTPRP